jgi:hypothetical protein
MLCSFHRQVFQARELVENSPIARYGVYQAQVGDVCEAFEQAQRLEYDAFGGI